MPTPDGNLAIAVLLPYGRDSTSAICSVARDRLIHRPTTDPRTGKPVSIHVHPISVIGEEYARARNSLVEMFFQAEATLGHTLDYAFWLDDDIVPPEDAIEKLLSADVPIASGLYFQRKHPYLPVAYTKVNDPNIQRRYWNLLTYPDNALMEVDAVGFGCVLIRSDVLRSLPRPLFQWSIAAALPIPGVQDVDKLKDGDPRRNQFDHRAIGEDMYFCAMAADHGYRIMVHTGVLCQHAGETLIDSSHFKSNQAAFFRHAPPGRKTICFITAPAPKEWDGRSLYDSSLGGSESAVAYLARSLARKHHTVFVICNTRNGEMVDVDGVCYRPYTIMPRAAINNWDALIISRYPEALDLEMSRDLGCLIFWSHDLMSSADLRRAHNLHNPEHAAGDGLDAFVSLTQFHAQYCTLGKDPWVEYFTLPNGVDRSLFTGTPQRDLNKLIWTSNPNRGLMEAVRVFRELRATNPSLEFHIYGRSSVYGWSSSAPGQEQPYLPDPDEPGVFLHDPLPKPQLAQELLSAGALLYPSTWPETFCIATLEAQAAGTPVLATPFGALPETVAGGVLTFDLVNGYHELMDNWELLSLRGKEFTAGLDWDNIADSWESLIDRTTERRNRYRKMV